MSQTDQFNVKCEDQTPFSLMSQTDQFNVKCEDQTPFSLVMNGIFVKIWKSKVKGVSYESDIRYAGQ